MSGLRVSNLRGVTAGSAPTFPDGVVVTGVSTATTFDGNLTGNVTGNIVGNVTGDVTGNVNVTGDATFTGDVSIGGTLTYQDVTNVDSVGVITARGGIRVGAGQSISAVSGIITYYGDGSQLQGVESGVSNFVATGTIDNGDTVVINTDGTVGIVTTAAASTPTVGSPVVFESATTSLTSATFDSSNNKVVIAYRDGGNSNYGTAVVGTVSGTSISFGSPVVFESASSSFFSATFDSSNNKVVIAYRDNGNSNYGTAIVGTVSGTSISFGSPVVFESASSRYFSTTFDSSNNKVVIAYQDYGNSSYGTAIVGTVSGTSISFGSPVVFNSDTTSYTSTTFDSSNNKVVIAYRDPDGADGGNGQAIVGTVSGTSISFGSAVMFETTNALRASATFDSSNNKVIIVYYDNESSLNYGKAVVGTVSGTGISFGSPVTFESASTTYPSVIYDSASQRVVIAYKDVGNSNYGTIIAGTVSGTSISFGSPVVFESATSNYQSATYDSSNNKVVIAYEDDGNSSYGTAIVANYVTTNLTTENFIGIAAESISDGATGKVTIFGGTNSGQTGLTTAQKYYVQNDGSLGTSAGNPSVVAGTSISSTKIIVKG